MRYKEIVSEGWEHYTEIGHKKKSSVVWYMMPGGKLLTHPFMKKADNHNGKAEGPEAQAIAVGRVDPKSMKISIRPPLAPDNSLVYLDDRRLSFISKRLRRAYPGYEIWYFGSYARDIRKIDESWLDDDAQEIILYHGTLAENLHSISVSGLKARIGQFVSHMYDADPDEPDPSLEEVVFLADDQGLGKCIAAIAHLIRAKTGCDGFDKELIRQHGALCVVEAQQGDHEHLPADAMNDGDHPYQVEPGDHYSRYTVHVDRVMVGDEMIAFFDRHGAIVKDGRYLI